MSRAHKTRPLAICLWCWWRRRSHALYNNSGEGRMLRRRYVYVPRRNEKTKEIKPQIPGKIQPWINQPAVLPIKIISVIGVYFFFNCWLFLANCKTAAQKHDKLVTMSNHSAFSSMLSMSNIDMHIDNKKTNKQIPSRFALGVSHKI